MSPTVAPVMPHAFPPVTYTSWTRLLTLSAMYMSPAGSNATLAGASSSDEVGAPPSPEVPDAAEALPATVYWRSAVAIDTPHWVPVLTGISTTRLCQASAMYMSPEESKAMPSG